MDGVVREGETHVDESLLTGESQPVRKAPGDAVTGGAINGAGRLVVETSRPYESSTLARIIDAQHTERVSVDVDDPGILRDVDVPGDLRP